MPCLSNTAPKDKGQPATAPPASVTSSTTNSASGILPTATEVARVLASEPRSERYTIQGTGVIEECFAHLQIVSGLVYVCGGEVAGVLQAAAALCYIGRVRKFLTEIRGAGWENVPYLIPETPLSEVQSARLYVNGAAGDVVIIIFR